MRFLIVEDEKRLAQTLADIVSQNSDSADIAYDGEDGLDYALTGIYDTIILDIMLPKMNGFDVLCRLREEGISTPVLLLTARTELTDRVKGLNSGADYYLTKPFETKELLACLRAINRRRGEIITQEITFGDLTLSLDSCELKTEQQSVKLSAKELELLRLLMENKGNIIPKETLLVKVWGYDSNAEHNHVEVYISFLRKKLQHISSSVTINAIRNVGYHLEANA